MLKRTVLYSIGKKKYQAQFVNFGGWEMPIRYSSVVEEHLAVRNDTGVFDVSHMGNFSLTGKDAYNAINYLISNDLSKINPGQAIYTPMLYENGTFVDDIIVYYHDQTHFSVVVNASNITKDFDWMNKIIKDKGFFAKLNDLSEKKSLIAIQGKRVYPILEQLFPKHDPTKSFCFSTFDYQSDNISKPIMVTNTGYTGEVGVEVWCDNELAVDIFEKSIVLGAKPCGLGARDSLRLEKGYSLYGHEINESINALEAGLGWSVGMDKIDFVGKESLTKLKAEGLKRKLIGFIMKDKVVARSGAKVYSAEANNQNNFVGSIGHIGYVTSGGYSPLLKQNIGLAYVPRDYKIDEVKINVRDQLYTAVKHKRVFC